MSCVKEDMPHCGECKAVEHIHSVLCNITVYYMYSYVMILLIFLGVIIFSGTACTYMWYKTLG